MSFDEYDHCNFQTEAKWVDLRPKITKAVCHDVSHIVNSWTEK